MAIAEARATYPDLEDKVVVVTGGATGIGAEIVRAFHAERCRVVFLDIDEQAGRALSTALGGDRTTTYVRTDVRDIDQLRGAIAAAIAAHGRIDVLVNNAARDDRHVLADLTPEAWDDCLHVNLRHHVFAIQAAAPAMTGEAGGAIVNLGSVAWMRGQPAMVGYHASKAAIAGITRALARELGASRIRVNSVAPGAVVTERQNRLWMNPEREQAILSSQALKFRIQERHVADVALFLASSQSMAITGQTLIVDAGFTLN